MSKNKSNNVSEIRVLLSQNIIVLGDKFFRRFKSYSERTAFLETLEQEFPNRHNQIPVIHKWEHQKEYDLIILNFKGKKEKEDIKDRLSKLVEKKLPISFRKIVEEIS